jgi:hypothetical protein
MHRDLRMQRMREQSAFGVIQSDTGFIAGGFDTENDHGKYLKDSKLCSDGIVSESPQCTAAWCEGRYAGY